MSFVVSSHPAKRLRDVEGNRIKRFWAKVRQPDPNACWPWPGCRPWNKDRGYMTWRGQNVAATHVSLALSGRPRPENPTGDYADEMFALHSCDNPICVNPAHLRWGTSRENAAEREERTYGRGNRAALKARAIEMFDQGMSMNAISIQLGLPGGATTIATMLATHRGQKEREKLLQSVG